MTSHDYPRDDVLLGALSASLDDLDPVPAAAMRAAASAWEICHPDGELAALVAHPSGAGVVALLRDEADLKALRFVASQLTVEIEVDHERHAVGVILPSLETEIEVETASTQSSLLTRTARSDQMGRFQVDLGNGLCRLHIGRGVGAVTTSWFYC